MASPSPTVVGPAAALLPASTRTAPSTANAERLATAMAARGCLMRAELETLMITSPPGTATPTRSRVSRLAPTCSREGGSFAGAESTGLRCEIAAPIAEALTEGSYHRTQVAAWHDRFRLEGVLPGRSVP